MTTQHAPYTPPMWRRFLSLPHTRQGWLAVGVASPSLLITAFYIVPGLLSGVGLPDPHGILAKAFGSVWVFSTLVGGGAAWGAVRGEHERSWLVVLSMVHGLLLVAFVLMVAILVGLFGFMGA